MRYGYIMVMVTHIVPLECLHFDEYNADNVTLKMSVRTSENASEKHQHQHLKFFKMYPLLKPHNLFYSNSVAILSGFRDVPQYQACQGE